MKHYPHHIRDFDRATRHSTRLERSIYRDLIDLYYDTETMLPRDSAWICKKILAHSNEESTCVEIVLNEFFTATPDGWYHDRCEEEIAKYRVASKNHWAASLPKHVRASIQGARNATKACATPGWLTKADRERIASIYAEAATKSAGSGIPHDVDHIVPLRSKVVCGLHVPWNLRAIPAHENRSKSNNFEVA